MISRFIFLFILFFILSCKDQPINNFSDEVLASVSNKRLLLSDVEPNIPALISNNDTSDFIRLYVQNWAKKQMLIVQAEKKIGKDKEIQKLVESYKSTLLLSKYQDYLAHAQLDSTITDDDYQNYFNNHKDEFILQEPVYRALFLKIPDNFEDFKELQEIWADLNEENLIYLSQLCNHYAENYNLSDNKWFNRTELELIFSLKKNKNFFKKDFIVVNNGYKIFYKALEFVEGKENPPLDLIKASIKKVILHKRYKELLQSIEEELFKNGLKKQTIKIFYQ